MVGVDGCVVVVLGVMSTSSTSSASVGSTCGGVSICGSASLAVRSCGMLTVERPGQKIVLLFILLQSLSCIELC